MVSLADQQRIIEAIRAQEQHTTGELVTVIADYSGDYRYYALLYATIFAALCGFLTLSWFDTGSLFAFLSLSVFGLFWVLMQSGLPRFLLPKSYAKRAASLMAKRCAIDLGVIGGTRQRTGVLLFVSHRERYVEVIADVGLAQAVSHEQWRMQVNRFAQIVKTGDIVSAYLQTIEGIGQLLAEQAPLTETRSPDELPNHLFLLTHNDDMLSILLPESGTDPVEKRAD